MVVTVEEMKNYLRGDFEDDDTLLSFLIEEADHHALVLGLRNLLFGIRKEGF